MRFLLAAIVLVATASLPTSALADSGSSARDEHAVRYYLSLGDSLAAGEQLPSDQNFGDHGYADQLWAIERESIPTLKLVKLGCGGETTSSMIDAVRSVPQGLCVLLTVFGPRPAVPRGWAPDPRVRTL